MHEPHVQGRRLESVQRLVDCVNDPHGAVAEGAAAHGGEEHFDAVFPLRSEYGLFSKPVQEIRVDVQTTVLVSNTRRAAAARVASKVASSTARAKGSQSLLRVSFA